mmetsp:Transcript_33042/g.49258  ORF Transcript_33042/g.49258 Transcript_33042/m.49258 type:complete len:218 (-) Transcript_33042:471-1124(-)
MKPKKNPKQKPHIKSRSEPIKPDALPAMDPPLPNSPWLNNKLFDPPNMRRLCAFELRFIRNSDAGPCASIHSSSNLKRCSLRLWGVSFSSAFPSSDSCWSPPLLLSFESLVSFSSLFSFLFRRCSANLSTCREKYSLIAAISSLESPVDRSLSNPLRSLPSSISSSSSSSLPSVSSDIRRLNPPIRRVLEELLPRLVNPLAIAACWPPLTPGAAKTA